MINDGARPPFIDGLIVPLPSKFVFFSVVQTIDRGIAAHPYMTNWFISRAKFITEEQIVRFPWWLMAWLSFVTYLTTDCKTLQSTLLKKKINEKNAFIHKSCPRQQQQKKGCVTWDFPATQPPLGLFVCKSRPNS